ncbi:hypothetical protein D3C85_989920 [compost metagenome]
MPLGIRRTGFQAHHVRVIELQLGHVFDGHQALAGRNQLAEDIQHGGLAGAGAATDQDVAAPCHRQLDEVENALVDGPGGQQVGALEHVLAKLADRQARAVQRHRRNDRIDPAAVGHARIDHG